MPDQDKTIFSSQQLLLLVKQTTDWRHQITHLNVCQSRANKARDLIKRLPYSTKTKLPPKHHFDVWMLVSVEEYMYYTMLSANRDQPKGRETLKTHFDFFRQKFPPPNSLYATQRCQIQYKYDSVAYHCDVFF